MRILDCFAAIRTLAQQCGTLANLSKSDFAPTRIGCFSLNSIDQAVDDSTVQCEHRSAREYSVATGHSFAVLRDAKTVVAVTGSGQKYLLAENIFDKNQSYKRAWIGDFHPYVVTYNSDQNILIAANYRGQVMGFRPPLNGSPLARLALEWGPKKQQSNWLTDFWEFRIKKSQFLTHLKCGAVLACDHFGSLTVLAGDSLVIVDTAGKSVLRTASVKPTVGFIRSVQFCPAQGQLLLALGGGFLDYSGPRTDVLDATPLAKRLDLRLPHQPKVQSLARRSDR